MTWTKRKSQLEYKYNVSVDFLEIMVNDMKKFFKPKKILYVLLIGYICYIFANQQITMNRIKKQVADKQLQEQKIKEKNEKLQDEVKMSKTDNYVEKLARERLGLIKEGETPVINTKNWYNVSL